jgi:hypothetical protein
MPDGSNLGHCSLLLQVVRKERAVGVVPQVPTVYEVLEEIAITAQTQLAGCAPVPFCAFNGGADVFVDVRITPLFLFVPLHTCPCVCAVLAGLVCDSSLLWI